MYETYTRSILDRYNIVSETDLREAMQRPQTYLVATADGAMKLRQERRKLPDALEAITLRREITRAVIDRSISRLPKIKADVEKASLSPEYRELLDRRLKRAFSKLGIATD